MGSDEAKLSTNTYYYNYKIDNGEFVNKASFNKGEFTISTSNFANAKESISINVYANDKDESPILSTEVLLVADTTYDNIWTELK